MDTQSKNKMKENMKTNPNTVTFEERYNMNNHVRDTSKHIILTHDDMIPHATISKDWSEYDTTDTRLGRNEIFGADLIMYIDNRHSESDTIKFNVLKNRLGNTGKHVLVSDEMI